MSALARVRSGAGGIASLVGGGVRGCGHRHTVQTRPCTTSRSLCAGPTPEMQGPPSKLLADKSEGHADGASSTRGCAPPRLASRPPATMTRRRASCGRRGCERRAGGRSLSPAEGARRGGVASARDGARRASSRACDAEWRRDAERAAIPPARMNENDSDARRRTPSRGGPRARHERARLRDARTMSFEHGSASTASTPVVGVNRRLRACHRARRLHLLRRRRRRNSGRGGRARPRAWSYVRLKRCCRCAPRRRSSRAWRLVDSSDVIFSRSPNASTPSVRSASATADRTRRRTHRSSSRKTRTAARGPAHRHHLPRRDPSHRRTVRRGRRGDGRRAGAVEPSSRSGETRRGNVGLKCKDTTRRRTAAGDARARVQKITRRRTTWGRGGAESSRVALNVAHHERRSQAHVPPLREQEAFAASRRSRLRAPNPAHPALEGPPSAGFARGRGEGGVCAIRIVAQGASVSAMSSGSRRSSSTRRLDDAAQRAALNAAEREMEISRAETPARGPRLVPTTPSAEVRAPLPGRPRSSQRLAQVGRVRLTPSPRTTVVSTPRARVRFARVRLRLRLRRIHTGRRSSAERRDGGAMPRTRPTRADPVAHTAPSSVPQKMSACDCPGPHAMRVGPPSTTTGDGFVGEAPDEGRKPRSIPSPPTRARLGVSGRVPRFPRDLSRPARATVLRVFVRHRADAGIAFEPTRLPGAAVFPVPRARAGRSVSPRRSPSRAREAKRPRRNPRA